MIDREGVTRSVIAAIAKVRELDEKDITLESTFDELKVDSLDAMEIIFEVEEDLDFKVPTEQMTDLETVKDVVDGIERLLQLNAEGKLTQPTYKRPGGSPETDGGASAQV